MTVAEFLPEPLPIVLDETPDESLSSWLTRHVDFYGIAPSAFSRRVGLDKSMFARIDYWSNAGQIRSLASAMRRTPAMILGMTHQQHLSQLEAMIVRGEPVHTCLECQTVHRRDDRATVVLKSWRHGWRITCPVCSFRLQETSDGNPRLPSDAFGHVWGEARSGEEMLANIDQLPAERAAFVVALLHLLLLRRSSTRNDGQRQIARGRVLDVVITGFDDIDRHVPFTVHTGTPLVVPLAVRVALLAGYFLTQKDPSLYDRMQSSCSGRERIRFDAVMIKLLADAHPAFSNLQQIRDSSPFWSRYFLQRKRKNRPVLTISYNVTPSLTASASVTGGASSPTHGSTIGRRIALVVANSGYRAAPLSNPKVDADLVRSTLEKAGFSVKVTKVVTLDGFEQAISDFARDATGADVAMFYFAGHGFSIAVGGRQENMLMATDADFEARTELGLEKGGEPLEHVADTIIGHARTTLVFIDACRNIPALDKRGISARGLAPMDASGFSAAFVGTSTRAGRSATDGPPGVGSPFARAFASVIVVPGLRIDDAYARIRELVRRESNEEQIPDVVRSDLPDGGLVIVQGKP